MTELLKQSSIVLIFILVTTISFAVAQPPPSNCSLHFDDVPSNSSCGNGDWGGFLHNSCCATIFDEYLYALGQRANQTGNIFLDSTQQRNCLDVMQKFQKNVFGCGFEQLTSGAGGCSDFSIGDVTSKFGDKLRSLDEKCNIQSSDGCSSCAKSWGNIRAVPSWSSDPQSIKAETQVCRFAVLVTYSRTKIQDKDHLLTVYKCLEAQKYDDQAGKGRKISTRLLILIGGAIGIIISVVTAAYIFSKKRTKTTQPPVVAKKTTPSPKKEAAFKDVIFKESGCPKIPIKEVLYATDNLSPVHFLGEGTAGKVYRGILSNNQPVAIKHIIDDENVESFAREFTSLSHIRHPNLVTLLGYCLQEDECFIVYELCPNGNLSEWLFGKDKCLSWIQRLEIAIDSAQGLLFLHTYPEGCIVHRDIKPTNILLGDNFEAKLSDFGLSKIIELGETYVSSEVRGTFGYVDPDYQRNHHVNSSGDVYSFGIVLLQILSGKRVINMNLNTPLPLNKMAKGLNRTGSINEFADPKLDGEYSAEAFNLTLQLALSCTELRQQRPSMEQIVVRLGQAHDISTQAKASTPEVSIDSYQSSNP
ncbi:probable LRR receptor-like serine/threonine-protein kinase At2g28960 [Rosa chinensis]|uniref:probable LRR receptor-like serine/threonine-protein kinase At2g28960 n=1 Tax=Rosa chinensis TaxID=74649 RepID=UPI000D08C748|nr:probable LRR receptor-like serine/threonine-protein kinase At2g28960 [Rosa chinensis]